MPDIARLTGRFKKLELPAEPRRVRPRNTEQIAEVLRDRKRFPSPVRAQGANSAATRCAKVHGGTVLDMSGMNRVLRLDRKTVTVEAGIRLRDLVRFLADHRLELLAADEQLDRSIGGIISSASLCSSTAMDEPHLAASVCGLGLVTPGGRVLDFDTGKPQMLQLLRQSYGLMGVIHEVTLRVRPYTHYKVRHGKMGFAELANLVPQLAAATAGVKIYLLPFRDRAFMELRDAGMAGARARSKAWQFGDWLSNKLLPDIVHLLRRIPGRRLRDPLIDGFSEATQALVNTRLVDAGSNSMEQTHKFRRVGSEARIQQSTWAFPAREFAGVLYSYREYCRRYYKTKSFRCDLPAVVYRLAQDSNAMLAPGFDGPVFALSLRTTVTAGWDDFLVDFAAIAARFGGAPLFNMTRGFSPEHAAKAYGVRLAKFRALRQQMDPQDRLLNQFFAEHIG